MNRILPARVAEALRPDAWTEVELPDDVLHRARRRVRIAALLGLMAYGVFLAFELSGLSIETPGERTIDLTHDAIGLVLCGTLWVAASLRGIRDRTLLALAQVAQVALCALIAYAVSWAGYVRTGHVASLSWVIPVIILFPLLVPVPPATSLIASIACTLTLPGALVLLDSQGLVEAHLGDYLAVFLSGLVASGIAFVAARTVYGATRQAVAARAAGSYELLEPLGRGGMGEVWAARHALLARPAAVKRIRPELLQGPTEARDEAIRRFTREARVTASLRSPHTVELFDFGVTSDGALYYAMERLDGLNAEHFVYRFGAVEPRRAVHWLRQICHSLAEAHARDLVHRDIKPSNVFLCRNGRDVDVVKVLDFGLTRPAAKSTGGLTEPGVRMGTAGYLAPELIFGGAADARSDLYAVGCVAWWLLAGRRPFESDDDAELLRMHAQEPPPPPAPACAHPVPRPLETLVLACLANSAADRPRDADALRAGLETCLDGARCTDAEAAAWWNEHLPGA